MIRRTARKAIMPYDLETFIREGFASPKITEAAMATALGISARHLRRIARQIGVKRKRPAKTGPKRPTGKRLTMELRTQIFALHNRGLSEEQIAGILHVTQPAVNYHLQWRKKMQQTRDLISHKRTRKKRG